MSTSNIFSNVFIYGNCTVQGTFTSLGGSAVSQWTTSGSVIYYSSGNVGIGTAAPVSTFEVTGTGFPGTALTRTAAGDNYGVGIQYSLISNTGSFRGYYARAFGGSLGTIATTNQNQANGYFGIDVANAGLFASDTYGYAGVQFYVAPTISVFNTRVGIGTTNPGSLLTVSGGGSFGSGYNAFTAPTGGLIVQGNVGIGTSNPGVNALQVTGNVVTSGFTSNATNTVFNYDTLTVPFLNATQVGVGTTAPDNTIDAVGSIVAAPVTFLGASNYGLFFRRGFSTSNFYNCSVMAYDHSGDTNPDGISINGYDGVSICTGSNTRQERVRILGTNGYVGIGTTNPGALFQVNAAVINPTVPTVHIGDNANDYGATYGMVHLVRNATPGDTKAHLTMIRSGNTGMNFGYYNNTNTFGMWRALQTTASTPTISISNSSDWVGIGTTNPQYTLHVTGPAASTVSNIIVEAGTNAIGQRSEIRFGIPAFSGTGKRAGITSNTYVSDGSDLQFWTNASGGTLSTPQMTILQSGFVGIGTTSPNAPLNVWGSGPYSGLTTNPQPGQLIINTTTGSERLILGVWYTGGTGSICSIQASDYYSSVDHAQGLVLNPLGGSVGIGTTSPTQLLSLNNGNILLSGTWSAGTTYSVQGYNTDKRLEFNYSNGTVIYDNNAFLVRTGGSSGGIGNLGLYQNSSGNVGIGTTNPGYTLDVNGSIRTTASLYYSSIRTSRTSLQTTGAPTFFPLIDISGGAYASKVTIHWNASSAAAIAFYFIDASGTNTTVSEYNISYFRAGAYSTGSGTPAYVAISNEANTGGVCEFLISKVTGRAHFQTTSTYCWASVGATRGQGQGYTTGNPNRIVLYAIPPYNVDWWAVTENYYT